MLKPTSDDKTDAQIRTPWDGYGVTQCERVQRRNPRGLLGGTAVDPGGDVDAEEGASRLPVSRGMMLWPSAEVGRSASAPLADGIARVGDLQVVEKMGGTIPVG